MQQQARQGVDGQHPAGRGGAEFLERRWRRTSRVPASERSPDVAAFVEAYQLMQQAYAMLPIDQDGQPALPDTPAAQQQMLSAMVRVVRADSLCPLNATTLVTSVKPLGAYYGRLFSLARAAQPVAGRRARSSRSSDRAKLAAALMCWLTAGWMLPANAGAFTQAAASEQLQGML
jgi:hypothetical protein